MRLIISFLTYPLLFGGSLRGQQDGLLTDRDSNKYGGREADGKYARLNAHGFYWTATANDSKTTWFMNVGKGSQSLYRQTEVKNQRPFPYVV